MFSRREKKNIIVYNPYIAAYPKTYCPQNDKVWNVDHSEYNRVNGGKKMSLSSKKAKICLPVCTRWCKHAVLIYYQKTGFLM